MKKLKLALYGIAALVGTTLVTTLTTNIASVPLDYLHSLFARPVISAQATSPEGGTVIQNSGGGTGADISVTGSQNGGPSVGLDTHGLSVTQTGPGTGMRVIVNGGNGPTIGVRSTVTTSGK